MHAGIPGTYFDSITNSALQALIGGVVSGAGAIIGGLISVVLAVLKLLIRIRVVKEVR